MQGDWPPSLRERVAAQTGGTTARLAQFARLVFGEDGPEELRRSQFLLAEVPVAAVRQHLYRREPPPFVDELICDTFHAVVDGYRRERRG